jgi:hypothetical protein
MIVKLVLVTAALLVAVSVMAGRTVRARRTITLNSLNYEIIRYSDDTLEVNREDGLRFIVRMNDGKIDLLSGTRDQLADAEAQMRRQVIAQLGGGLVS